MHPDSLPRKGFHHRRICDNGSLALSDHVELSLRTTFQQLNEEPVSSDCSGTQLSTVTGTTGVPPLNLYAVHMLIRYSMSEYYWRQLTHHLEQANCYFARDVYHITTSF